jgi:hypothetical protein
LRSSSGALLSITLPHEGANDTSKAIADGIVAFESSDATSTVAVAKTDGSVQLNTIINGPEAPNSYTYDIRVGDGGSVQLLEGGAVFLDADGNFVGGAAAPWAKDATGNDVPTWYTTDGTNLVQHVDTANVDAYPVVADPYMGIQLIVGSRRQWDSRKRGYKYTFHLSAYAHIITRTSLGAPVMAGQGWQEAKARQPGLGGTRYLTLRQQWLCHCVGSFAVTGSWDIESYRPPTWNTWTWVRFGCNW